MYDAEGSECLKNIPEEMHQEIILANQESFDLWEIAEIDTYALQETETIIGSRVADFMVNFIIKQIDNTFI